MDNRRRFQRIDREFLASYCHFDLGRVKDDEGMAKTLNMSIGGLLLLLPQPVMAGTGLEVALNLDGQVVELVGKVAHCKPNPDTPDMYDVGIEFQYVPKRFSNAVERYFTT